MAARKPKAPGSTSKQVPPSRKRLTIADIAKAADVSTALVSSFMTGRDYAGNGKTGIRIGETTAERIRSVCRELDYRPDRPSTFNRIYPERGEVALAGSIKLSFHVNRYYSLILDGVVEGGAESGVKVSVVQFDPGLDYEKHPEQLPRSVHEGDIRKFILVGNPNLSFIRSLLARDITVVYLSRYVDLPGVVSIVPDYAEAATIAVRYLAGHGHRKLGFVALSYFKDAWHGNELQRGATAALKQLDLPCSPDDFKYGDPTLNAAVKELMERPRNRPTAIFAFDDLSAEYALRSLHQMDLRVPEQVSVVGCNDERQAAIGTLPLSTIHLPVTQMGARAVHEANSLAAASPPAEPVKIVLPVYLVERASSGPAPK